MINCSLYTYIQSHFGSPPFFHNATRYHFFVSSFSSYFNFRSHCESQNIYHEFNNIFEQTETKWKKKQWNWFNADLKSIYPKDNMFILMDFDIMFIYSSSYKCVCLLICISFSVVGSIAMHHFFIPSKAKPTRWG